MWHENRYISKLGDFLTVIGAVLSRQTLFMKSSDKEVKERGLVPVDRALAKTALTRRPYRWFTLWGVPCPWCRADIDYAAEHIRELYFKKFPTPNGPMQALLEHNEKIVSRCGMLMTFSGTLMVVSSFIATNPRFLSTHWQRWGFYVVMAIWFAVILLLLWSLAHHLPVPWQFGTRVDLDATIRLFLCRMGLYNLALLASVLCFVTMMFFLAPISVRVVDQIFGSSDGGRTTSKSPSD